MVLYIYYNIIISILNGTDENTFTWLAESCIKNDDSTVDGSCID